MVRTLESGGTERQLTETAKFLGRLGWNVHVGCFHAFGQRVEELSQAGVRIVEFPVHSFLSPLSLLKGMLAFRRYTRKHHISLVHSFDYPTSIFAAPAAKLARCPVLLTSQRSFRELRSDLEIRFLRYSDWLADGIVVNCNAVRKHLIEDEKVRPDRIRLCYNGLDNTRFYPDNTVDRPPELQGSIVVGTLCVLRPEKGLSTLMEGFSLAARHNSRLRLLIVGGGEMGEELRNMAVQLGIRDKVMFQPDTADVSLWLNRMDIFVLASKSEAFSNALMEAMACRVAPVATNIGGNPELVRHGETGLLFDVDNASQLSERLLRLASEPELRMQLALAAREFVVAELTLAAAASRMGEIYREHLTRVGLPSPSQAPPAFSAVVSESEKCAFRR